MDQSNKSFVTRFFLLDQIFVLGKKKKFAVMVETDISSASKDTTTRKFQVEKNAANASAPYSFLVSNNPRALITSVMFTGENYNEWSSELVNALKAKWRVYWWFNTETCHRWSSLRAPVFCQFNDCWVDLFFYRSSCSFNSYAYIRFSQVVGEFKVTFLSGKQSLYPSSQRTTRIVQARGSDSYISRSCLLSYCGWWFFRSSQDLFTSREIWGSHSPIQFLKNGCRTIL